MKGIENWAARQNARAWNALHHVVYDVDSHADVIVFLANAYPTSCLKTTFVSKELPCRKRICTLHGPRNYWMNSNVYRLQVCKIKMGEW